MEVKVNTVEDVKVEQSSSVKKTIAMPVAPKTVSGRDIISQYVKGDPVAMVTYRKICSALEILEKWETPAKVEFLKQFLDLSDLLDNRCNQLVTNLAKLPWACIPTDLLPSFQLLLCDIAVRHLCHTELICTYCVGNLLPIMKHNDEKDVMELALSKEEQDKYYTMSHQIIAQVLKCFPMSSNMLANTVKKSFPHMSRHTDIIVGFCRNVIQIMEYAPKLREDIWELLINNMIQLDCLISRDEQDVGNISAASSGIFVMDEDEEPENNELDTIRQDKKIKLDRLMKDVLVYLAVSHEQDVSGQDVSWLRLGDSWISEMFGILMSVLEKNMLMAVHVRYTSFIWLYLASLEEKYTSCLLESLWSIVVRPQRAPADAKKAQGAAAYLAAFLARAKYIKISQALPWLSRIAQWCIQYIDQCGVSSSQIIAGVVRHGTFYALCQSFFIAFSFLYKEIDKSGDMDDVRRWGLGRIIHSPFEPLKYVSRPVALCFAAISRSLQLVYCNHVLPLDATSQKPFEPMFPLDSFKLISCESVVIPLMRKFSPLAEDVSALASALKEKKNEDDSMDFLDDEEMQIGSFRDRSGTLSQCGPQSNTIFTLYSSSPGLRHFDSPMNMR